MRKFNDMSTRFSAEEDEYEYIDNFYISLITVMYVLKLIRMHPMTLHHKLGSIQLYHRLIKYK